MCRCSESALSPEETLNMLKAEDEDEDEEEEEVPWGQAASYVRPRHRR